MAINYKPKIEDAILADLQRGVEEGDHAISSSRQPAAISHVNARRQSSIELDCFSFWKA
jgi:hypothetical protein